MPQCAGETLEANRTPRRSADQVPGAYRDHSEAHEARDSSAVSAPSSRADSHAREASSARRPGQVREKLKEGPTSQESCRGQNESAPRNDCEHVLHRSILFTLSCSLESRPLPQGAGITLERATRAVRQHRAGAISGCLGQSPPKHADPRVVRVRWWRFSARAVGASDAGFRTRWARRKCMSVSVPAFCLLPSVA